MRKPYKNQNSNARFVAAGFCATEFSGRGVKFFALQNAGFFAIKFGSTKFCSAEPRAHDAALRGFKFCNETLRHTRQIRQSRHSHFKFHDEKFNSAKFQEMEFQTLNLELKMKFNAAKFGEVKFRDGALLKFAAAKELRRSPSLCAAAPFKFTAPQNAGFFATKFNETEFYGVKFHKARLRRAKFYAAEFAAKGEKFCGTKRRRAGA